MNNDILPVPVGMVNQTGQVLSRNPSMFVRSGGFVFIGVRYRTVTEN